MALKALKYMLMSKIMLNLPDEVGLYYYCKKILDIMILLLVLKYMIMSKIMLNLPNVNSSYFKIS